MQIIRDFYRAIDTSDEALLRRVLSPAWEEIPAVYPGQTPGAGGYMVVIQGLKSAFPDLRIEIVEVIEAPPKYTVRTTIHGTHKGAFLGRQPTGKTLRFDTIDIHEVQGGMLVRCWHIEDFGAALRQMSA